MLLRQFAIFLLAAVAPLTPAFADGPVPAKTSEAEAAKFAADRANILKMAGTFKVKFDFQEQTAWQPDYTPIAPKVSGGHEVVRVIEDAGRRIVLQHILVVEAEGKTFIVKHWRQDWTYEPASVLVYNGPGRWKTQAVPPAMQKGRWSQTVWQTDDSPRYGGWGEWTDDAGIPRWRSSWTWRPLARRDAVRKPVYDRYCAINRHSPTPNGWIHWQDNIKMGLKDGKLIPYVQESVLNTYAKATDFNAARADEYWARTKGYWAAVRSAWDGAIASNGGVTVAEVAETGSITGERLMKLADEVEAGKVTEAAAINRARTIIGDATSAEPAG